MLTAPPLCSWHQNAKHALARIHYLGCLLHVPLLTQLCVSQEFVHPPSSPQFVERCTGTSDSLCITHSGAINLVNRLIPLWLWVQARGGLPEVAGVISLVLNCSGGSSWHPRSSSSRWAPSSQLQAWPSHRLARSLTTCVICHPKMFERSFISEETVYLIIYLASRFQLTSRRNLKHHWAVSKSAKGKNYKPDFMLLAFRQNEMKNNSL